MYFIETKVASRPTYYGHISFEYLPLICMAAAATKSRGGKIYLISAEFRSFFFKNVCYSVPNRTYLLLVVKQV
jgi:hypothetical protein